MSPPTADELLARATAAYGRGQLAEAGQLCAQALTVTPDHFDALHLTGVLHARARRSAEALAAYDKALATRPGSAEALNNRGIALKDLKRFDEAVASYDRALASRPDYAKAWFNRGVALSAMNRWADATASHARAVALQPGYAAARVALCMAELPILYADESEIAERRTSYAHRLDALREAAAGPHAATLAVGVGASQPYYLAYQGQNDRDLMAKYGATVCRLLAARFGPAPLPPPPAPGEKLRVGIVSGFFRTHSNWKQPISGWLSQLDRARFRVFGYYTAGARDAATATASGLCERFVQGPMPIERWRAEIARDAPHILIYPEIGMDTTVPALAGQRLAPVQCSFWGHPETSGMPTVDYFLSSELMEPDDGEAHYTERLVRLPNLSIYYEPLKTAPRALDPIKLGMRPGATRLWCGQTPSKYLPQHDSVFARIAGAARNCQFVFVAHAGDRRVTDLLRERLRRAFAANGLDSNAHCLFLPRLEMADYQAAMGLCDIFLDSIGWSGGNTTLESLAHDLPIVTLPGALMRGRHSTTILRRMEVSETIAASLDDYVAIAARLALESEWRRSVKLKIAASKHRVYRDRAAIVGLEDFLERAGRSPATVS